MRFSKIGGISAIIISILMAPAAAAPLKLDQKAAGKISNLIVKLKEDPKGPFETIMWFCPDGSRVPPTEKCPEKGGLQRAVHKGEVIRLQTDYGIYLGQILSGTSFDDFLDRKNNHSRFNQYVLEKYLKTSDDGWILKKGKFYRGAFQVEDEESWGKNFLMWLLSQNRYIRAKFFLCREAVRSISHREVNADLEKIRVLSKEISEAFPPFNDLRAKIHGHPDQDDHKRVNEFIDENLSEIPDELVPKFDELLQRLLYAFSQASFEKLNLYIKKLPAMSPVGMQIKKLLAGHYVAAPKKICMDIVGTIILCREEIIDSSSPDITLSLLELSLDLEILLFRTFPRWKGDTVRDILVKCGVLTLAAAGCGFIELREWEMIGRQLEFNVTGSMINLDKFARQVKIFRRVVEWSTGMVRAQYLDTVDTFSSFDNLAPGFIDDRIRSSIILHFASTAGLLEDYYSGKINSMNYIFGLDSQNQVRGLNPGFTRGRLNVITGNPYNINFRSSEIYIMTRPPSNLKPVAGIATVTEGNAVSHVQLLARNLGIPNAVLSPALISELKKFSGEDVFYAVSPGGTVIIKEFDDATRLEKNLFEGIETESGRIRVPMDKLNIKDKRLLSLQKIRASDSGKICGPKAANLGELRFLFPDNVAPGFIIPFGVFDSHMRQVMPKAEMSYRGFLEKILESSGSESGDAVMEERIIAGLTELRTAVRKMPFYRSFTEDLRFSFMNNFGRPIGQVPVFIRSDTNVEDLKDFSGAGLNLTVPNVAGEAGILQAIRDVWASPFTERSYRWRQKFLLNPVNVFPSILILQSINCDKSGVIITAGLDTNSSDNITVSFSRGIGGAVEGQAAESYEISPDGSYILLSPSREPAYKILPESGGVRSVYSSFAVTILDRGEISDLIAKSKKIGAILSSGPAAVSKGPYDIEMGFLNKKIWLFQVRPFVESKSAESSAYLRSLDPDTRKDQWIKLDDDCD